jgi:hypothetical protein
VGGTGLVPIAMEVWTNGASLIDWFLTLKDL